MISMTTSEIETYIRAKDENSLSLVEFTCLNIDDKYMIEINDNHSDNYILLVDSRNKVKKFISIDSAFQEIKHITNTMTVCIK